MTTDITAEEYRTAAKVMQSEWPGQKVYLRFEEKADRLDAAQAQDAEDRELAAVILAGERAHWLSVDIDKYAGGLDALTGDDRVALETAARAVLDHLTATGRLNSPGTMVLTAEQAEALGENLFEDGYLRLSRLQREQKAQRVAEWLIAEARFAAIPPGAQVITEDEAADVRQVLAWIDEGAPRGGIRSVTVDRLRARFAPTAQPAPDSLVTTSPRG